MLLLQPLLCLDSKLETLSTLYVDYQLLLRVHVLHNFYIILLKICAYISTYILKLFIEPAEEEVTCKDTTEGNAIGSFRNSAKTLLGEGATVLWFGLSVVEAV